jgi:hypothetical protein
MVSTLVLPFNVHSPCLFSYTYAHTIKPSHCNNHRTPTHPNPYTQRPPPVHRPLPRHRVPGPAHCTSRFHVDLRLLPSILHPERSPHNHHNNHAPLEQHPGRELHQPALLDALSDRDGECSSHDSGERGSYWCRHSDTVEAWHSHVDVGRDERGRRGRGDGRDVIMAPRGHKDRD